MDYSLNKRNLSMGGKEKQVRFVASIVCQKQRITFENLCETMSDGATVSEADVAAVLYQLRKVLNKFCSQGYIVDAGPLGTFRPTFTSKSVEKEDDFKPSECITKAQILFTPRADFRQLKDVEYFRVPKQDRTPKNKKPDTTAHDSGSEPGSAV